MFQVFCHVSLRNIMLGNIQNRHRQQSEGITTGIYIQRPKACCSRVQNQDDSEKKVNINHPKPAVLRFFVMYH